MESAVRLVRLVQIALLSSVVLYAVVGELAGHSTRVTVLNSTLWYAVSLASIATVGAALVVRRTLVLPADALLRKKPNDPLLQARWKTGYIFPVHLMRDASAVGLALTNERLCPVARLGLLRRWIFAPAAFLSANPAVGIRLK